MLSVVDATEVAKAVTAVATAVTPVLVWLTHRKVKKVGSGVERVDDAVNRRHEKVDPSTGTVPPKLYDLVLEDHHDIGHLKGDVLEIRGSMHQLQGNHQALAERVIEHVGWEEGVDEEGPGKYGLILDRLDSLETKVANPWREPPDA